MTIFYRGPCIRITHEHFEVRCPVHRVYPLRHLDQPHVVERVAEPPPALTAARTGSASVAGAIAVVAALGWVEGWHVLASPVVAVTAAALLGAAAIAASGACWRARAVEQELVARYHGTPVSLYRGADPVAFGQVRRGLTRALERLDDRPDPGTRGDES